MVTPKVNEKRGSAHKPPAGSANTSAPRPQR